MFWSEKVRRNERKWWRDASVPCGSFVFEGERRKREELSRESVFGGVQV